MSNYDYLNKCQECGQKLLEFNKIVAKIPDLSKMTNSVTFDFYCMNGHNTCFHFRNNKLRSVSTGGYNVR